MVAFKFFRLLEKQSQRKITEKNRELPYSDSLPQNAHSEQDWTRAKAGNQELIADPPIWLAETPYWSLQPMPPKAYVKGWSLELAPGIDSRQSNTGCRNLVRKVKHTLYNISPSEGNIST